jgi:hypothetical protein
MGEKTPPVEPREILKLTRREVVPYMRQLQQHRRAIIPRIEISKRWVNYYEELAKTRKLKPHEIKKLGVHRQTLAIGNARIELYRAAGKYARTKKPMDLSALRQAQSRYYEEKIELLPPEEQEEEREKFVPPEEAYDELERLDKDIRSKCQELKEVKAPTRLLPLMERYTRVKVLGELLREDYARVAEITKKGASMSEFVQHYRQMQLGEEGKGKKGKK